jgi:cytochrome P450
MNVLDHPGLTAGLVGVGIHQGVLRHGEWNLQSHHVFNGHALALTTGLVAAVAQSFPVTEVFRLAGCYLLGLFSSMLLYRAFFHRLQRFNGPFAAKLSKIWLANRTLKKWHMFLEIQQLHEQYGDVVRVGPEELSIRDANAVELLYGAKTTSTKGTYYSLFEPFVSLQSTRDDEYHARLRKVWDQGFSIKALPGYNSRIASAIADLLEIIDRECDKPINITEWFSYFTFDIVEDLGFNKKTGVLRKGGEVEIFQTIRGFTAGLALTYHIPWLANLLRRIPFINKDLKKFENWTADRVEHRVHNVPDEADFFGNILKAYQKGEKNQDTRDRLIGDAQLTIAAGSDTVAQPLIWLFYYLAHNPDMVNKLREELSTLPSLSSDKLQHVDYLNALINETLRLHPPIISGTQRKTPAQGITIGDLHIPGNVNVMVPCYTVQRDARYFEKPNEFIPERWTTKPEMVMNKAAFFPFNIGLYQCVGKRLAMMELRQAAAEVLTRYNIAHVEGHDSAAFHETKTDVFIAACGALPIKFTPL